MEEIPITSLSPNETPPPKRSIRAIVTLSWPYSSSTRQCALLLADRDFRLRNSKGQVRVRFTGASAEAVAKSRVGIGDEVVLELDGANWEQDPEATRTPGRSVDGELLYKRYLRLDVVAEEGNVEVRVDAPQSPSEEPNKVVEVATPLPRAVTGLRASLDGANELLPGYTYTSPAFVKRLRLSGDVVNDSVHDPFTEEDINPESKSETNWTQYRSKLKWRVAEKTPSPKKVQFAQNENELEADRAQQRTREATTREAESPSEGTPSKTRMPPPPLPQLQTRTSSSSAELEQQEGPTTPTLQPVRSPTLPLPSPFPTETRQMQFGLVDSTVSIADSNASLEQPVPETEMSGALADEESRVEDVTMIDQQVEQSNATLRGYASDTEPDDEFTQQALFEQYNVRAEDAATAAPEETTATLGDIPETISAPQAAIAYNVVAGAALPATFTNLGQQPHTPQKISAAFALDGASSAPSSAHATPQSEKDRVMAQTYRSLFGFTGQSETASQEPLSKKRKAALESPKARMWFSDVAPREITDIETVVERVQRPAAEETLREPRSVNEERLSANSVMEDYRELDDEVNATQPTTIVEEVTGKDPTSLTPDGEGLTEPKTIVAEASPVDVDMLDQGDVAVVEAARKDRVDINELHAPEIEQDEDLYSATPPLGPRKVEQEAPEEIQQQSNLEPGDSEIEVIDLASSSEGEEEPPAQPAQVQPPPQKRVPRLEIQDSLADPESEDLLAGLESQPLIGRAGILGRRAEASKLSNMVAETSSQDADPVMSQPFVNIERETSSEVFRIGDPAQGEILDDERLQAAEQAPITSPLSSPPPGILEEVKSPEEEVIPLEADIEIDQAVSSPLRSATPQLTEQATSPVVDTGIDELPASANPEVQPIAIGPIQGHDRPLVIVPPKSSAPVTVIDLGSSSPIQAPEEDVDHDAVMEVDLLPAMGAGLSQTRTEYASLAQPDDQHDVSSPLLATEELPESEIEQSPERDTSSYRLTTDTLTYPSLPLSPSYSQSLPDIQSQQGGLTIPETLSSVFPPTPQLTQIDSFSQPSVPTTGILPSSQHQDVQPEQEEESHAEVLLPPSQTKTPAKKLRGSELRSSPALNRSAASSPMQEQLSSTVRKTPARKAKSARVSNVPDVISAWFSPRRSIGVQPQGEVATQVPKMQQTNGTVSATINGYALSQPERSKAQVNGLSTSYAYFTPLSRLDGLLNPSSQQSHGTNAIDVLAVVVDATKEPVRAKAGPRDYFTIFKVSDHTLSAQRDVSVEIYRPSKTALPTASVGDVILLRAFAIKSRERQPYLLSTDASAWCVWRYGGLHSLSDDSEKPIWARKGRLPGSTSEEITGPPVELGPEERQHASWLKEWWETVRSGKHLLDSNMADDDAGMNERVNEPVAAKL